MQSKSLKDLRWFLAGKSLLGLVGVATVVLALVSYGTTVTLTISPFFKVGTSTINWLMTTSSGTRFLPGVTSLVSNPNDTALGSYAFRTQTGAGWVKIGITQAVALFTQFLSFKVFLLSWNSSTWVNATVYTDTTLLVPIVGGLDGTSTSSVGYLKIVAGGLVFFAVQVNYQLGGTPIGTPNEQFSYTPNLN